MLLFILNSCIILAERRALRMSHKILAVDDEDPNHQVWREWLQGKEIEMLSAYSTNEAEKIFNNNPDIVAIIMDGHISGGGPTSEELVQKMREKFKGPIIAASGSEYMREKLMEAGCDYWAEKWEIAKKVIEVLGI